MRSIMCFSDKADADQAVKILNDNKIKAAIKAVPSKSAERELFPLHLDDVKWDEALEMIDEAHLENTVRCPDCGSHNIEFPQTPQASAVFHAVAKVSEMLSDKKTFYCHQCHHHWPDTAMAELSAKPA